LPTLKRLFSALCTLLCVSTLPFILPGCDFNPSGQNSYGPPPHTSVIFCDIERGARRCAGAGEDLTGAVNRFHYYQQGFWLGEAQTLVLDNSADALTRCGGRPEVIQFRGPFPAGQAKCVSPAAGFSSVSSACTELCEDLQGMEPAAGDRPCEQVVLASWRATLAPFPNACTDAGALRPDFVDPRIGPPPPTPTPTPVVPRPVVWRDVITPATLAVSGNSLRKTGTAAVWDSGAASSSLLLNGDGFFEFAATETTLRRIGGLSIGGFPDSDAFYAEIDFGLYLQEDGMLRVIEAGTFVAAAGTIPYASGDRIRVAVTGGAVEYAKNGQVFYRSTSPVMYPLRVDTSFFDTDATITDAWTSF
jgi:hypothetical protein